MKTIANILIILALASAMGCANVSGQQPVSAPCEGWTKGDGCSGWNQ